MRTLPASLFACLVLIAAPACLASVSAKQVKDFLESKDYWKDEELYGAQAVLYRALEQAPANARVSGAAATLASKWSIDTAVATTLIESAVLANAGEYRSGNEILKTLPAKVRGALAMAPQSAGAWNFGVQLLADHGGCWDLELRDGYFAKPFAASDYPTLLACNNWVPHYARLHPDDFRARFALARFLEDHDTAATLAAQSWALDVLPRGAAAPPGLDLAVRRSHWIGLARAGLFATLLEESAGVPAAEMDALLHRHDKHEISMDSYQLFGQKEVEDFRGDLRRQWLAALIAARKPELAHAEIELHQADKPDEFIVDALAGKFPGDIYERYVADGRQGLLADLREDGATTMRVAADFLDANHMETAAGLLRTAACNRRADHRGWPRIDADLQQLPADFRQYRARYAGLVEGARAAAGCGAQTADIPMSSRLPHYPEIPLQDAERTRPALPGYAGKIPLPPSFRLVRAEEGDGEIRAVCISPAVDPSGEVGSGGYWLLRSRDEGANWLAPAYLGFQDQNPYTVPEEGRVSMFAPGALRLEVQVAELDPESITFPPVGLALRREASDIYVDIPLEQLDRDTDGDGLTDFLEAKLGTDPANADTDGDGLTDRLDDFPQASARAEPSEFAPIIVDVLKKLVGFERAGIIEPVRKPGDGIGNYLSGLKRADAGSVLFQFIEGDARQFAGLRAEGQVIVLDARQVAEISARSGPFFPLSFPAILVDPQRTRALVEWDAGWTGGTILYHLENGKWKSKDGGSWITQLPRFTSVKRISPG